MEEVGKEAKTLVEKFIEHTSKGSNTKQIIVGTTTGWISGLLVMKVAKVAVLAMGGGILLLQFFNQNQFITINYDKFRKSVDETSDEVRGTWNKNGSGWIDKVLEFVKSKTPLSAGFAGGFLIGLASH